jgi:NADPH:quinone reductase-like Zn-dependent oxidoreductase
MKAYYSIAYGGPEASVYGDLPEPVPSDGQVLVEVRAASINPADYKVKRGDLKLITGSKFPRVVGSDFAGIVKETGAAVKGFRPGDKVYGGTSVFFGKPGALSELLVVEASSIRLMPDGLSFEEAASMPVAALTALSGIRVCKAGKGVSLLVNGATGGVGHFAVQIAKARGAKVTATCSPANAELARKLGADHIIGYTDEELVGHHVKYDAIMDAYGKMNYEDVCRLLKRGGIYASTLPAPKKMLSSLFVKIVFGKKLTSANMRAKPEDYDEIERLYSEKKLIPVIENIFSLDKAADAFEVAEKGRPRGKVIVRI